MSREWDVHRSLSKYKSKYLWNVLLHLYILICNFSSILQVDEELSLNIKGFYFVFSNERNISSKQTRFRIKSFVEYEKVQFSKKFIERFLYVTRSFLKKKKSRNEIRLFSGLNYILA